MHDHGGLSDPPVIPRECEGDGVTDSQQLNLSQSLAERVQTVRSGGCPSMPGHGHGHGHASDGAEARNVGMYDRLPDQSTQGGSPGMRAMPGCLTG